ncbi:MAG TPA: hypothetical protein DEQ61_16725 [Streptomyces sp.]|nr:hypothetical protein [Streptomyces sp.]
MATYQRAEATEWELADERRRLLQKATPYEGTCKCGRTVRVHLPKGGDGCAYVTYWHKRSDAAWCRSEVDFQDVHEIGAAA